MNAIKEQPIGFFDSGLGGLSVISEVRKLLPRESIEYFADNQRQPYGEKNQDELIDYTLQIISFLIKKKIKICVIACNTATAASLKKSKRIFFYSYNWCYPTSSSGCHKEDFKQKDRSYCHRIYHQKRELILKRLKKLLPK